METDYYRILGVAVNATEQDIKKAYRSLSKRYHPDMNPGDGQAEKKFRDITQAYAVLGDTDKRKAYDKGRQARKTTAGNFEQFFGFRPKDANSRDVNKKKDSTNPVDVTEMFEKYMGFRK